MNRIVVAVFATLVFGSSAIMQKCEKGRSGVVGGL